MTYLLAKSTNGIPPGEFPVDGTYGGKSYLSKNLPFAGDTVSSGSYPLHSSTAVDVLVEAMLVHSSVAEKAMYLLV